MKNTLLCILLLISVFVNAQAPAIPDSTFNGTGRKIFSIQNYTLSFGDNVAVQPDGKIIMTGAAMSLGGEANLAVVRMNTDGSYDNTFGTSGTSIVDLGVLDAQGGFEPEIYIQADGKIVICGYTMEVPMENEMLVCRLLPNGSLDAGFGTGGKTWVSVLDPTMPHNAYAVTGDAAGNIYACGSVRTGGLPFNQSAIVIKLTPSGQLDPTFSEDGKIALTPSTLNNWAFGIAVQADGKVIVGGYSGLPADFMALRLLPDGTYDPTFGTNGITKVDIAGTNTADECKGMTIAPDGKILLAGHTYYEATTGYAAAMVRLTADGMPDNTFGNNGKFVYPVANTMYDIENMYNVVAQPNGKYLLSGDAMKNGNTDFAVLSIKPDGTLDQSFNQTGVLTIDVTGTGKADLGYGLALQADGKILVSGNTQISEYSNQTYSIMRILNSELMAAFSAAPTLACIGQQVQYTNGSIGNNLSYNWYFEGGTPVTSTMQNPLITYNLPGVFDTRLVVSNPNTADTLVKNNLVEIRNLPVAPSVPTGLTLVCGTQSLQYETQAVDFASSYTWVVTPAAAGTLSGNNTTVTFTSSLGYTGPYTVKVQATGLCGSSPWSPELSCHLYAMPAVFSMLGGGNYCQGTNGVTISLSGSETGVNYELYHNGISTGQIQAGTGNPVSWPPVTLDGNYTSMAFSDFCSDQMTGQSVVTMISIPVQPDIPIGAIQACKGLSGNYHTYNVPSAASYNWTLDPSNAGVLLPNGTEVTVNWSSTYTGVAQLKVNAENECGISPASPALSITVYDVPVPVITGQQVVCTGWTTSYETTANAGNSYNWTVAGGTIVSGAGTPQIEVLWNVSGTGTIQVDEINTVNCTGTSQVYNVLVDPCVGIEENQTNTTLNIYPNPSSSTITISPVLEYPLPSIIMVLDITGRKVLQTEIPANSAPNYEMNISALSKGIYLLHVINDGKTVKQMKLVKK
jgi:uncharacterized delta-60 repeat protein